MNLQKLQDRERGKGKNHSEVRKKRQKLIDNDNLEIAMNAASNSLRKNINIDKAIKRLEEISKKENSAEWGVFRAEIVLRIWREKGAEGL